MGRNRFHLRLFSLDLYSFYYAHVQYTKWILHLWYLLDLSKTVKSLSSLKQTKLFAFLKKWQSNMRFLKRSDCDTISLNSAQYSFIIGVQNEHVTKLKTVLDGCPRTTG